MNHNQLMKVIDKFGCKKDVYNTGTIYNISCQICGVKFLTTADKPNIFRAMAVWRGENIWYTVNLSVKLIKKHMKQCHEFEYAVLTHAK